jgi:two-component system osmolarity sensor histidine kinase EnvZ
MRRRIQRHVEQRTAMLAGVSHDLRTILTRFKLQLAFMEDDARVKPLKADVLEMQHMLEDYMAFVKGDGGERVDDVALADIVNSVVENAQRNQTGKASSIEVSPLPETLVKLKRSAFKRLMANLVGNAVRYGKRVQISGHVTASHLWLFVDDDGPGIAKDLREQAFKPFVRLDNARNLDETGTGLGLAIALDIAHAHGGDIELKRSPLGGLRVEVRLPV